jgi:hypothetical protein
VTLDNRLRYGKTKSHSSWWVSDPAPARSCRTIAANGTPVVVWNSPGTDETTMRIPNPDPGELWTDINMRLSPICALLMA